MLYRLDTATAGGHVRVIERNIGRADFMGRKVEIMPRRVADAAAAVWSGTISLDLVSETAAAVRLRFTPDGGAPLTITGISPTIEEAAA